MLSYFYNLFFRLGLLLYFLLFAECLLANSSSKQLDSITPKEVLNVTESTETKKDSNASITNTKPTNAKGTKLEVKDAKSTTSKNEKTISELRSSILNPFSDVWYFSYADAFKIINDDEGDNRIVNSTNIKAKGAFYLTNKYNLVFGLTTGLRLKEEEEGGVKPTFSYSKFIVRFAPKVKKGFIYSVGMGSSFPIDLNYDDIPKDHDVTFGPNAAIGYVDPNYTFFLGTSYVQDFFNTDSIHTQDFKIGIMGSHALGKRFFIKGFGVLKNDFAEEQDSRLKVPVGVGVNAIISVFHVPINLGVNLAHTVIHPANEGKETTIFVSIAPIIYKGKKE